MFTGGNHFYGAKHGAPPGAAGVHDSALCKYAQKVNVGVEPSACAQLFLKNKKSIALLLVPSDVPPFWAYKNTGNKNGLHINNISLSL